MLCQLTAVLLALQQCSDGLTCMHAPHVPLPTLMAHPVPPPRRADIDLNSGSSPDVEPDVDTTAR